MTPSVDHHVSGGETLLWNGRMYRLGTIEDIPYYERVLIWLDHGPRLTGSWR